MNLIICPSRGRPERVITMLESFYNTRSDSSSIIVYVADDDPKLNEYKDALQHHSYIIGPRRTIVEVFNYISQDNPGYAFYGEINDDHVFRTKGWDKILTDKIIDGGGWGIACGRDLMHDGDHQVPSGLVMSSNIIDALGWMAHPSFKHTFIDNYWGDLAKGIGKYYYCPEVIIEHRHLLAGKAEPDDNYRYSMSQKAWIYGQTAYNNWVQNRRQKDIDKVLSAMNNFRYVI